MSEKSSLSLLTPPQKEAVFEYLFGSISKFELRARLGGMAATTAIWSTVVDNGYIMRNCKLFAWAKHLDPSTRRSDFEIAASDMRFLSTIDLRSIRRSARAYSLQEFISLEEEALLSAHMKAHVGKFVNRKLIFLHRYYGVAREDIHNQLLCAGLYALRKQYPFFETRLHAQNIVKAAIHNAGMGLIEYHTRKKRNSIAEGRARTVSLDSVRGLCHLDDPTESTKADLQALVNVSAQLPTRYQQFLSAAAGITDQGLSMFIGEDNALVAEASSYDKYLETLRDYFRVSLDEQINLLTSLRNQLT